MIRYESGGRHIFMNMFKYRGSVFPVTLLIATPAAVAAALLTIYYPEGMLPAMFGDESPHFRESGILKQTAAWGGLSFFVGFLIVFRTSEAYTRFSEGCTAVHRMRAEWFDAFSSLIAFTTCSTADPKATHTFEELLIRLASMLHSGALAELEAGADFDSKELWAHSYEILDPNALDSESMATLLSSEMRVELIFAWIQQLVTENIEGGVLAVPPPILSRVFQELSNGMVAFQDAKKICEIPFPFPYAQVCDSVLLTHWVLTPVVMSVWVTNPVWSAVLSFIQIFVLWSLNLTAIEIDNPFGKDDNDLPGEKMQMQFNIQLRLRVSPKVKRTPKLSPLFNVSPSRVSLHIDRRKTTLSTFKELLETDREFRSCTAGVSSALRPDSDAVSVFSESSSISTFRRGSFASEKGSVAMQIKSRMDAVDLDEALQCEALLENTDTYSHLEISESLDGKDTRSSSTTTCDTTIPDTERSCQPDSDSACTTYLTLDDVSSANPVPSKVNAARRRQSGASEGARSTPLDTVVAPLPRKNSSNKILKARCSSSKGSSRRSKSQSSVENALLHHPVRDLHV